MSILFIEIAYDLGLPSGVRNLSDPFSSFSWIEVGLTKGAGYFATDLGLGVADMSIIDCASISGIADAPNY